ncbi:RTA-like protein [Fusarium sp. MPI-SDFR-AT-0072]|nr:RTA-like protein [Fusarium sp. MPI-SDFR-AT-0072]
MPQKYNLGANAFFLVCFSLLLPAQLFLGIKYKTWGYMVGMVCGLILEILGYAARTGLSKGIDLFLMYIVTLTIGPAFLSAAIYLCLARIIPIYGQHLARFRPMVYTTIFILLDFLALLLQSAGGALVGGDNASMWDTGLSILKAGLSIHLVGIVIYSCLCFDFALQVAKNRGNWQHRFALLQASSRFRRFCSCLAISTLAILIRTAFRVAELSKGFHSKIAESKPAFLVLDGTMVLIASLCLTAYHPGPCFEGYWPEANFSIK